MGNNNNQGTVSGKEPSLVAQVHISVRGLVEFLLRHGDIDNSKKGSSGPEVMLEGANIHRMIQRRMGTTYHSEYYLRTIINRPDYQIIIDGRADGVVIPKEWEAYIEDVDEYDDYSNTSGLKVLDELPTSLQSSKIIIDEIKSTHRDLEHIKEPEPVHLAQAKCYAYMLSIQNHLPNISVRMTYVNVESHETRYFDQDYTYEEITKWFDDLIKEYIRWSDFSVYWKQKRNASIAGINFPYSYREGQKELVAQVFNSIEKKEKLFVMAPTGVGKTLANMYPSLKALSMGRAEKIFYLTAKTITRTVAADCLNLLRQQYMNAKSITLTAKEKICPMEKVDCDPRKCPYAKGHFDRINDAMYDMLSNEDEFSREKIMEYSEKHQVCAFEFSLDMSLFADVVICDYNYVFDPNVYLRRFFGEASGGDYLFLVDEAHNLTERAMSMYSAELIKEKFLDIKRLVKDVDPKLYRSLEACNKNLLSYKRMCEEVLVVDDFEMLVASLLRLSSRIEQFLDDHEHFEESDEILEFYFEIRHFLNIYENMREEDYVMYVKHTDNGEFMARLMCANPANWIKQCTDKARFTVFFSATLLPIAYYRKLLGADETDPAVYAKSVFNPNRRGLFIGKDVTSKYTRRNDAEYDKMAEYISTISRGKKGNYLVFFPSFAMLDRVYELFVMRYYDENSQYVISQAPYMTERDREDFIKHFTGEYEGADFDKKKNKYASEYIEEMLVKTTEETEEMFVENYEESQMVDFDKVLSGDGSFEDIISNLEKSEDENISYRDKTLIGFCVLGGIFSEGIDLKGDALVGAIIIGTGLPMVCPERQMLKNRYDEMGLNGFDYAYKYPGMNKVEQAAGRVIRTEEDKGVVALLDERFLGRDYRNMFPREWENYIPCRVDDINEYLEEFWKRKET